jgi:hypothetical protein
MIYQMCFFSSLLLILIDFPDFLVGLQGINFVKNPFFFKTFLITVCCIHFTSAEMMIGLFDVILNGE